MQFFESFSGKKRTPQSEFRAKSYGRFKEDPPNQGLLVVETESDVNRWGEKFEMMQRNKGETQTNLKHELNQQQRHEHGHKLNTTDSERELCKRLNNV